MSASFTSISESEGEPHPLQLANLATLDPDHITQALMRDLAAFQRGSCWAKSVMVLGNEAGGNDGYLIVVVM